MGNYSCNYKLEFNKNKLYMPYTIQHNQNSFLRHTMNFNRNCQNLTVYNLEFASKKQQVPFIYVIKHENMNTNMKMPIHRKVIQKNCLKKYIN